MRTLKHPSQAVFAMYLVACLLLSSAKAVLAQNLESRQTAIHLTVHQANQPQDEPLVSIVQKDVIVEEILRELAQIDSLDSDPIWVIKHPDAKQGPQRHPLTSQLRHPQKQKQPQKQIRFPPRIVFSKEEPSPFWKIKNLSAHAAFEQVLKMSDLSARRLNSSLLVTERENPPDKLIRAYSITSKTAIADIPPLNGITGENRPLIIQQMTSIYRSRRINPLPDIRYDKASSIMVIQGTEEAMDIADRIIPILDQDFPIVTLEAKLFKLSPIASLKLKISDTFSQNGAGAILSNNTFIPGPCGYITRPYITITQLKQLDSDFVTSMNALLKTNQASLINASQITTLDRHPYTMDLSSIFPAPSASPKTERTQIGAYPVLGNNLSIVSFVDTEKKLITISITPEILTQYESIGTTKQISAQTTNHRSNGQQPLLTSRQPKKNDLQIIHSNVVTARTNKQVPQGRDKSKISVFEERSIHEDKLPYKLACEGHTMRAFISIQDGETAIIGGLTREETVQSTSKIPFLNELPILGELFSRVENHEERFEIMLMLTPHILKKQ